ncbi:MAG: zf-HC2 domain-containing protein, partial [Anaerolineales bacterium]|nr:zf-HC2 domain-containing protein [Anaerolineales bacterium]
MKHEPYREWLLDDGRVSEEQASELQAHLAVCDSCRRIQRGWQGARSAIEASAPVGPADGFVQRFELRLAARRAADARRQVGWIFALSVVGALGSALLLLVLTSGGVVNGLAETLRTYMAARETVAVALGVLFDGVGGLSMVPIGVVLLGLTIALLGTIATLFTGLGGLWAAAVYRYAEPELTIGG